MQGGGGRGWWLVVGCGLVDVAEVVGCRNLFRYEVFS